MAETKPLPKPAPMPTTPEPVFVCSCEDSFAPDRAALAAALPGGADRLVACRDLCRSERSRLDAALPGARSVTIACRQEEPAFRATLEEAGFRGDATFVDLRDRAGWSSEAADAAPKMAALLAESRLPPPALPFLTLESQGIALVYGRDAVALEAAEKLAGTLDVTVLLDRPGEVMPRRRNTFPVARGTIRAAKGHLGAFELTVDGFAPARPSSRGAFAFEDTRDNARSACDLVIDLSGNRPLFSADGLRDGYLRADPRDPLAVERLIARARELVGTFDKPKYIAFAEDLCAHSRSKITGCTRCLEVCPTGAISPAGDHVAIDPAICAGCGGCASVCPTGAASYALPAADHLMRRLRALLTSYADAGGKDAAILFHDASHGADLIDALARFGEGLPARVLPVEVNEITQVGIEQVAAGFAYGAAAMAFLAPAKPKHDLLPLRKTVALAAPLAAGLGHPDGAVTAIETDDPDALLAGLRALPRGGAAKASRFAPVGSKRPVMLLALREWHSVAPEPAERVPLPAGAPFGRVAVDAANCTLCLACVSACPVAALSANPERPELRFQEDLCVQCGLCQSTCPEKVITLEPRLDFTALLQPPVTLKEEEPHACDQCGKLFGTKATIARIKAKLSGAHWMYSGPNADRLRLIGYCDDCRVEAATLQGFDPYAGPERPRVRTSEDYFRERESDRDET